MTMQRISVALGILAIALLTVFVVLAPTSTMPQETFGATNTNQLIGGFPYFLAGSGISSSATSITLTSLTLPQTGYKILTTDLGQPFFVTIEPGSTSRQEFDSCTTVTQNTNNTATLSGCVRGLMPIAPYTTNSNYAFSHSGGTTLIFSNSPQFYQQFYALGNVATSTNTLVFGSTTPPQYDADPVWGNFSTKILADVSYVNSVVAGGAANASETVKGIIQLATGLQAASSTSTGSTGARLALGANIATDTPNVGSKGSKVLMSSITGFLSQAWLDLSTAWTFTGPVAISPTGSLTANGSASFNGSTSFNHSTTGLDWQVVASSTLASANALLQATTTGNIGYLHYRVYVQTYGFSTADVLQMQLNNDTGNNYSGQSFLNYVVKATATADPSGVYVGGFSTTSPQQIIYDIYNPTTTRKSIQFTGLAGATGNVSPQTLSGSYVWNNLANQITNFEVRGTGGQTFNASTTMTVYGSNAGN